MKKYTFHLLLIGLVLCAEHSPAAEVEGDGGVIPADGGLKHDDEPLFMPSTQSPIEFEPVPRIVGGTVAADRQFPHQVSLRTRGSHTCGGSIISTNYVLTAAHCVTQSFGGRTFIIPARILSVRAGSNLLSSGGIVANVAEVKVNRNYAGFNNDIALLRLAAPLTFNDRIRAIPLNTGDIPVGASVITSGWGRLGNNAGIAPQLQYVTLRAISNDECSRRIGLVPSSILCLGKQSSGFGVCSGDSGGPAVYANRLIGVTNFVVGGCGTTLPDGYAKVSSYISWIRQNSDA